MILIAVITLTLLHIILNYIVTKTTQISWQYILALDILILILLWKCLEHWLLQSHPNLANFSFYAVLVLGLIAGVYRKTLLRKEKL